MKGSFVLLLAATALCACTNEAVHVETISEYVDNPRCWGGSMKVRQGYLVLLKQDEPYVYIFSQNCVVERYAGQGSVLSHFSFLKIEGSSKTVEDELGIEKDLGANFLTSREFPSLKTPVYEVQFSLEEVESNDFMYFKLSSLEMLDRPPRNFEDILVQ